MGSNTSDVRLSTRPPTVLQNGLWKRLSSQWRQGKMVAYHCHTGWRTFCSLTKQHLTPPRTKHPQSCSCIGLLGHDLTYSSQTWRGTPVTNKHSRSRNTTRMQSRDTLQSPNWWWGETSDQARCHHWAVAPLSYLIEVHDGLKWKRHIDHIRCRGNTAPAKPVDLPDATDQDVEVSYPDFPSSHQPNNHDVPEILLGPVTPLITGNPLIDICNGKAETWSLVWDTVVFCIHMVE